MQPIKILDEYILRALPAYQVKGHPVIPAVASVTGVDNLLYRVYVVRNSGDQQNYTQSNTMAFYSQTDFLRDPARCSVNVVGSDKEIIFSVNVKKTMVQSAYNGVIDIIGFNLNVAFTSFLATGYQSAASLQITEIGSGLPVWKNLGNTPGFFGCPNWSSSSGSISPDSVPSVVIDGVQYVKYKFRILCVGSGNMNMHDLFTSAVVGAPEYPALEDVCYFDVPVEFIPVKVARYQKDVLRSLDGKPLKSEPLFSEFSGTFERMEFLNYDLRDFKLLPGKFRERTCAEPVDMQNSLILYYLEAAYK